MLSKFRMATYLLPCDCGKKLRVEAPQAGQMVRCSCGKSMEVPTIRGLARLDRARGPAVETGPRWGPRQGLILLGAVIAAAAVSGSIWLQVKEHQVHRDYTPTGYEFTDEKAEQIRQDVDRLSPADTWRNWESLRKRVDRKPTPTEEQIVRVIAYRDGQVAAYRRWRYGTYGIVALGAILIGAALLFTRSPRTARKAPPAGRRAARKN